MSEFLHKLFSSDFMGHGYCYLWKPEIVWLHAISDGLIAISYYFIPVVLTYLVRKRRDLPFHWVFFMFGLFILSCGTTHALEIWTLWHGTYRLAGLIKAIAAGASVATAVALVPIVPRVLRLPSPAQLRAANLELQMEISERKRVEAALRESEERFRRVFEEGPLGLALVGTDYRFTKVNSALCEMVGYPEAELVQKTFTEITHPDDVGADVEFAKRLFKREIPSYCMQKRYQKKNGEFIWINLTASIIRGADGQPLHGLAMIEDITEIKRTQEEALFRQKLESVGTLAGGIAHDFNNLLGAIQAQAELGLWELEAGSSCKEELNAISEVAMRGSEIVRQLMIYAGKDNGDAGPVDLSRTVEEMLSLLKVSVTKHAVIEAHLDPNLPAIRADAAQLRQIVMNLVTNASDAIGDQDGVIRVITRCVTEKRDGGSSSSTFANGEFVELEVTDTGSGMSLQTQAQVFDPFFTTKSLGRGLGLAVVQGIVRSLGGAIHLATEPDKGTTFKVLLPSAKIKAASARQAMSGGEQTAFPSEHGTVLVVEDEDQLRQGIVMMLRKTGFDVFESAEGSSAIKFLRGDGHKIDVVLLDMTMPGASVHEIIAEAVNAKPDIKVILTSAYSQEMVASSMTAPQIHSFIRKPFQFADLLKTLRSSLSS